MEDQDTKHDDVKIGTGDDEGFLIVSFTVKKKSPEKKVFEATPVEQKDVDGSETTT